RGTWMVARGLVGESVQREIQRRFRPRRLRLPRPAADLWHRLHETLLDLLAQFRTVGANCHRNEFPVAFFSGCRWSSSGAVPSTQADPRASIDNSREGSR